MVTITVKKRTPHREEDKYYKEMPHNKRFIRFISVICLIIFVSFYFLSPADSWFKDPQDVKNFVLQFGSFAWIAYVALQIIQVVIPILPGQLMSVAGGYIFGFWIGFILNYTSVMVGSILVFWLGRKYGKPLVLSFVSPKEMMHVNAFIKEKGPSALVLARLIPLFPNDTTSFVMGLTTMSYKKYILASLVGFLPHFIVLNLFGARLAKGITDPLSLILLGVLFTLATIYVFRQPLKKLWIKEVRLVEQEFYSVMQRL